jgi:uncharacterized protein YutE (UPF0331/DUF86 family)
MEENRKKRYVEKIKHAEKRISEFNSWKEAFFFDEKTKLACYKAIQEIIETVMDLVSMLLKDEKEVPKDDYTNIGLLEEKKIITGELTLALKELNGLRNRIVHEYNGLDDEIAFASIEELLPKVEEFLKVVKEWLKKKI